MNITLSADEKLIEKARSVAAARGTTLNEMIRDYMRQVTGETMTRQEAADEFVRLALSNPGRAPEGWKFNREEAHERGRRD
jgi:hypothetical protein